MAQLQNATAAFIFLMKIFEVIYIITLTTLIITSGITLCDVIIEEEILEDYLSEEQKKRNSNILLLVRVVWFLLFWNLLYNNLLVNLRFKIKTKSVTCGMFFFDCINSVTCWFCAIKFCRDRIPSKWFVTKWLIYTIVFAPTIYFVMDKKNSWLDEFQTGATHAEEPDFNLDIWLILYLLQHPIFFIARIPLFALFSCLTCCCDKDGYQEDHNPNQLISFDYIEYNLRQNNNFRNHARGLNEIQYNRSL